MQVEAHTVIADMRIYVRIISARLRLTITTQVLRRENKCILVSWFLPILR